MGISNSNIHPRQLDCVPTLLRVLAILLVCLFCSAVEAQGQHFGLMVGVDGFGSTQSDEASCSRDAETLAETLSELGFSVQYSMENAEGRKISWTRNEIFDRIRDVVQRAEFDRDVLLVSLHGQGSVSDENQNDLQAYFHAMDSKVVEHVIGGGSELQHRIAVEDLYKLLSRSRAKTKMMVLDITCKDNDSCAKFQAAVSSMLPRLRGMDDTVVFSSCVTEESAAGIAEVEFIQQFKRGIQGIADLGADGAPGDGIVTLAELQQHMRTIAATRDESDSVLPLILGNPDVQSHVCSVPSSPSAPGLEMVHIPAGKFRRGSRMFFCPTEQPVRTITITRPFYVAKYEITISQTLQWLNDPQVVVDRNWINVDDTYCPIHFQDGSFVRSSNVGFSKSDRQPIFDLSKDGAVAFCGWCSRQDSDFTYRLPTEAEWEYMARAGSVTEFPFGDLCDGTDANIDGTRPLGTKEIGPQRHMTTEVGSFSPNAWGIFDTVGNVSEWCIDLYDLDYYRVSPTRDPVALSGIGTMRRGGNFSSAAIEARSSFRNVEQRHLLMHCDGFGARVVAVRNHK